MKPFLQTLLVCVSIGTVIPCTEFILRCSDEENSILIGRTYDWGAEIPGQIVTEPKGTTYSAMPFPEHSSCFGTEPMSWNSKVSQLFITGTQDSNIDPGFTADGLNGAGLAATFLYFRDYAYYPPADQIPKEKCGNAISQLDVQKYIQTRFTSVKDLRKVIEQDNFPFVYARPMQFPDPENPSEMIEMTHPLHWSVTDRTGESIIIEYTKTGRHVYDNTGVFTNSPDYEFHLTNLKNYINLQPVKHAAKNYTTPNNTKMELDGFGKGTGLLGVPGDYSTVSRFIRAFALVQFSGKPKDPIQGALQAWHILNSVDKTDGASGPGSTIMSFVKDLTNNIIYFRYYDYLNIRKVELNNASTKKRKFIKIAKSFEESVEDVTSDMQDYTARAGKNEL